MSDLRWNIFANDHASRVFEKVGRSASTMGSKVEKTGHGFKKMGMLAAVGIGALATASLAAGYAVKKMVENGAKDEAGQRRLAVALRNTTGARKKDIKSVEDWIYKTEVAKGVTDDDLRPALQKLAQATGSITKAQKQLGIALDVSAGSGKSLETVTAAMAKAHNGNMGALSRLGVKIKDVHGKTLSYNQVLKQMAATFKGQSTAAAESFDGKMARLGITFDEMKETVGQALIPVLDKIATWFLNKGIPGLSRFKPLLNAVLGLFKKGGPVSIYYGKVLDGIKKAIAGITKVYEEHRPEMELFFSRMKIIAVALTKVLATGMKYAFIIVGKAIEILIVVISKLVQWTPKILQNFIKPVVMGFLDMADLIVSSMAIAFGWIPGVGDRLQKARHEFSDFKDGVSRQMDTWAENLSKQGEKAGTNFARGLGKGLAKANKVSVSVGNQRASVLVHVNLPPTADGGIVTRAQARIVGEAGPEAIIPLKNFRGGFGGVTVIINGSVLSDEKKIASAVLSALKSERNAGRSLGLTG